MRDKPGQPHDCVTPVKPLCKIRRVRLPLLKGTGRPGPRCPSTQTPYDLVFGNLNP